MTAIIILICVLLISVVLVQIGKVTELTGQIKGEREVLRDNSKWNGWLSVGFMVVFLVGVFISSWAYKNEMMGYGPHQSASAHGGMLDDMFNITLILTGIVFVLTHIALFWFAYKYRWQEGRRAQFIAHDNRLELIWTAVPAVVMTVLVVRGLNAWNTVMADVKPDEDYIEIEATGQQFNWIIRFFVLSGDERKADFYISNTRLGCDKVFDGDTIITVERDDAILSLVKDRRRLRAMAPERLEARLVSKQPLSRQHPGVSLDILDVMDY